MPPKVSITKELILEAAFKIVREGGLKGLTARHIAKNLNCSTAPVYSTFKNMAELEEEVMKKARELLIEYTKKEYTEIAFLNTGVGFTVFSRDNKNLYKELFLKGEKFIDIVNEADAMLYELFKQDPQHIDLPDEIRKRLFTKMRMFTQGLASLACAGLLEDDSDEFIIELLMETGACVIRDTYKQASENTSEGFRQ